jgi:hypothetical protein
MLNGFLTFLVIHFLATGERLEIPRFHRRDVLPSKLRVVVGPFRDCRLDIANVSDCWASSVASRSGPRWSWSADTGVAPTCRSPARSSPA